MFGAINDKYLLNDGPSDIADSRIITQLFIVYTRSDWFPDGAATAADLI